MMQDWKLTLRLPTLLIILIIPSLCRGITANELKESDFIRSEERTIEIDEKVIYLPKIQGFHDFKSTPANSMTRRLIFSPFEVDSTFESHAIIDTGSLVDDDLRLRTVLVGFAYLPNMERNTLNTVEFNALLDEVEAAVTQADDNLKDIAKQPPGKYTDSTNDSNTTIPERQWDRTSYRSATLISTLDAGKYLRSTTLSVVANRLLIYSIWMEGADNFSREYINSLRKEADAFLIRENCDSTTSCYGNVITPQSEVNLMMLALRYRDEENRRNQDLYTQLLITCASLVGVGWYVATKIFHLLSKGRQEWKMEEVEKKALRLSRRKAPSSAGDRLMASHHLSPSILPTTASRLQRTFGSHRSIAVSAPESEKQVLDNARLSERILPIVLLPK